MMFNIENYNLITSTLLKSTKGLPTLFHIFSQRCELQTNVRKRVYCYTIWLQLMIFVDPACRCFVFVRNFSKQTHAQSWPNTERPKCFESWAAHFGCEKFNSWSHIVKQYTRFRTSVTTYDRFLKVFYQVWIWNSFVKFDNKNENCGPKKWMIKVIIFSAHRRPHFFKEINSYNS